ncbi:Hypothetical predicted protein [Paramuricea clavata]|uniref:Transmembrane protein 168 n=1 Tax=Paramuricea clavata TaxID=317549 RepID=A0A6S7KGG5_PARCT|nr:Hypothetical predicted protein [Paramuricea clavata]
MAFDMERLIKYISAVAIVSFLVGGFLGIYSRWEHHSSDKSFIIFGVVAAVFLVSAFVLYLLNQQELANAFLNLWIGIIFSVLTFTSVAYDHMFVSAQDLNVVDMLLIGSTCIYCCGTLLDRIHNYGNVEFHLLTIREVLLLVGFTFGSVNISEHCAPMVLLALAVACNLITVHLKSALSLVNVVMTSVLVAMEFFPAIKVQYNPFCLATFAILLSFEAIIDMYFSEYSTVDRWKGFLTCGKWCRKSLVVLIFLGECIYVACAAQVTLSHHRAVVIVPIFFAFLLFWIAGHIVFLVDCWGFLIKLEECSQSLKEEFDTNTMLDVLASRGVRYFCLISKSIILITIATTVLLGIPSWQVTNTWFISSFLIVMPVESMVYSVLSSLGKHLGGTAIGYAVVIPLRVCNIALPEAEYQGNIYHLMINLVSRFFSKHIVHNFGTDLCTSGLTLQSLKSKLEPFFNQRVLPGLPYDTFVLYYSGPVCHNGDWALLENNAFSLNQLLSLWEKMNGGTGARLILVLDTETSHKWLPGVKKSKHFIGAQVGIASKSDDLEAANSQNVGELTKHWVYFNSAHDHNVVLVPTGTNVRPTYAVSRRWCEFKFHVPTQKDISLHIEKSYPAIVQPIMRLCNRFPQSTDLFCFCNKCVVMARNLKMRWLPPLTLDTGHGFKLIRTINKM